MLPTQTAQVGDLKIDDDLLPTKPSASHPAWAAGRHGHMYSLSPFPSYIQRFD